MIIATVRLAGCDPERALAAFTDPAVLAGWWGGALTAKLVPGGEYSVNFRTIPARLTGGVIEYTPGNSLQFSWSWEGEDDSQASTVTVSVSPEDQGASVLTIEHGPHGEDEAGRRAHAEHWAGWEFFLPRLLAAFACRSPPPSTDFV
jgi:uncharacterized protein YndB with AHSA1/START domain